MYVLPVASAVSCPTWPQDHTTSSHSVRLAAPDTGIVAMLSQPASLYILFENFFMLLQENGHSFRLGCCNSQQKFHNTLHSAINATKQFFSAGHLIFKSWSFMVGQLPSSARIDDAGTGVCVCVCNWSFKLIL